MRPEGSTHEKFRVRDLDRFEYSRGRYTRWSWVFDVNRMSHYEIGDADSKYVDLRCLKAVCQLVTTPFI
ncbi:hypothetical protein Y032_0618g712 [Ancylostoma ceylanicum]|uniref:Uncharacterized protein n=1 Tax=Ancylostoma ceylanicum TaxID=53326 RepID=A0A016WM44_9BILA|nr:hypothetical protein Y032_0618g712 [Ancylostoma ceylanicum]